MDTTSKLMRLAGGAAPHFSHHYVMACGRRIGFFL